MTRTPLKNARRLSSKPVRRLGAGVVMMGLAISAAAKDNPVTAAAPVIANQKTAAKPSAKARHWYEVGLASWYGQQFQGRKTAGGEKFDMNSLTCAHPSLPMGTWLRVTNLKNRKTTFVRVNDRGPVVDGRIVDLSYAAAQALGMVGLGHVRLEAVRDSDPELMRALVAQVQMPLMPGPAGIFGVVANFR